mgnify:CR=1 FL=1
MAQEIHIGKISDFKEGDKKIVPNGKNSEIGVYLVTVSYTHLTLPTKA